MVRQTERSQKLVTDYESLTPDERRAAMFGLMNRPTTPQDQPIENRITTWQDMAEIIGPIEWDWKPWLPKAMNTLIVGESGEGKSILMLRTAACFLCGWDWPDGSKYNGELGAVVWCEAEAAQVLNLERAKNWKLPLDKIYTPMLDPLEDFSIDDSNHLAAIIDKALLPEVRAIYVDSLSGAIGGREKDSDILPRVRWFAELARNTGKPVISSHHLRKRTLFDGAGIALERVRGTGALVQTARLVWALDAPDLSDKTAKRLQVIKSNLAKFPDPIGLSIDDGGVTFGDAPEPPRVETQQDKAIDLLQAILSSEPLRQIQIEEEFKGAGISWPTANRAKKRMGIVSKKKEDGWYWSLPSKVIGDYDDT